MRDLYKEYKQGLITWEEAYFTANNIAGTKIKAALVSTNSITQGESVSILWEPLFNAGLNISFAHRTFRWDSEATIKAHVHCVIIGFQM